MQIGGMVGAIVFGKVADSYGRRPSSLVSLVIYNLSLAVVCLSPNFGTFVIMRFFAGIGQMGFYVTMAVFLSEYMVPKYRRISTALTQLTVTFGLMFMALLAFLITDWRFFTLALLAPTTVVTFVIWFLPESLRWLISRDKGEEVVTLVRRLSNINGVDTPTTMYDNWKSVHVELGSIPESADSVKANYPQPQNHSSNVDFQNNDDESVSYKENGLHPESSNATSNSHTKSPYDFSCFPISESSRDIMRSQQDSAKTNETICGSDTSKIDALDPQDRYGECIDCINPDDKCVKTDMNTKKIPPDSSTIRCPSGMSGITESVDGDETITTGKAEVGSSSFVNLFKPPVLHVTIVISIFRFTIAIVYFGFVLNTGRLEGNPYVNFFLSALVEIPAKLLSFVVYKWFRRTYIVCVCYSGCFMALTTTIFIPSESKGGVDLGTLIVVLSLVGKFFVTLSMSGLLLLVMELFPTTLRNIGNGLTLCVGRSGGMIAPFMLYADIYIENFSTSLMAVMSLVTAVIVLTLPDTRTTPQPQSAQDLRNLFTNNKSNLKTEDGIENTSFNPNENIKT